MSIKQLFWLIVLGLFVFVILMVAVPGAIMFFMRNADGSLNLSLKSMATCCASEVIPSVLFMLFWYKISGMWQAKLGKCARRRPAIFY